MSNDDRDEPLREQEQQMRRALGVSPETSPKAETSNGHTLTIGTFRQQPRRFVREGDVPVTQLRREPRHQDQGNSAVREAIRVQVAARENTERQLSEVQARLHSVQTRLGHETIAKEEATKRAISAEQSLAEATETIKTLRTELVQERVDRQKAEERLQEALEARTRRPARIYVPETPPEPERVQQAESRPNELIPHPGVEAPKEQPPVEQPVDPPRRRHRIMITDSPAEPKQADRKGGGRLPTPVMTPDGIFATATLAAEHHGVSRQTVFYRIRHLDGWAFIDDDVAGDEPTPVSAALAPPKRGRPALAQAEPEPPAEPESDDSSEFVEWWKPGWRRKFGQR